MGPCRVRKEQCRRCAPPLPAGTPDGDERLHLVINEVGEAFIDKGLPFADLDVVQTRLAPGMPAFRSNPSWQRTVEHVRRLQQERRLDAADMGVAKAEPAELDRYRAKQKQTHNRYIQKHQAATKRGV